ncbi:MAG: ABC transporter ATP-binding protein [Rickettsiales bacterium]|nr:ABC transporter ATP-binding protein [Rickettsiales bacterium]
MCTMLFKIKNLEYQKSNKKILSNLNFDVEKGKHLLILGSSGSGKTSLINIMSGLLKPTNGEIFFKEYKYSLLLEEEFDKIRATYFGFIFQKLHLIGHLNVKQNIDLIKNKIDSNKLEKLILRLGLTQKSQQMVSELSVGEAQRVAIARGLANSPKVIFADEPTSSLDDYNAQKVIELILDQTKQTNATLIVSTHDKRIKKYFSKITEMSL